MPRREAGGCGSVRHGHRQYNSIITLTLDNSQHFKRPYTDGDEQKRTRTAGSRPGSRNLCLVGTDPCCPVLFTAVNTVIGIGYMLTRVFPNTCILNVGVARDRGTGNAPQKINEGSIVGCLSCRGSA